MPKKKIKNPLPSVQEIEKKLAHLPPSESAQRLQLIVHIYEMTNAYLRVTAKTLQKRFADRLALEDAARIQQIKQGV